MTRQERRVGDEDDLDADVDKPFPRHWMTLHLREMMAAVAWRCVGRNLVRAARIPAAATVSKSGL